MAKWYLIVLTCLLISSPLPAQHLVVLDSSTYNKPLSAYAQVYTLTAGQNDVDRVMHDTAHFEVNNYAPEVNYGFDQRSGWCRFVIQNHGPRQTWVLVVQQSRVDTVQLLVVRDSVVDKFEPTGHFQPMSQRAAHALNFAFEFPLEHGEVVNCYLYSHREYGRHAAVTHLQRKDYFETYQTKFLTGLGLIEGTILVASLIGLVLFFFIQEKVYLYYTLYALAYFFVIATDAGYVHAFIHWHEQQTVMNGLTFVAYYLITGVHILFTIELVKSKDWNRRWIYWFGMTSVVVYCAVALLLLLPFLPLGMRAWLIDISYFNMIPLHLYIIVTLAVAIRKREMVVILYMVGFLFSIVVGTILILSDMEILKFPNLNKDIFFLTPLPEILFVVVGFGIQFAQSVRKRYQVQLELTQTQDQIITIQEDERRRIAQDLHDDVGNSLAAVRNMVVQRKDANEVEKEINNIIHTVRGISHNLIPVDFNEFSLRDIVAHLVDKFKNHPSIQFDFVCSENTAKLKPLTELVIYRVINELINNILKHSQATKALVQLMYQSDSLVVTVEDDGIGLNTTQAKEGIGLKSIRLRAAYIGAKLGIESGKTGTLVILEIPYSHE